MTGSGSNFVTGSDGYTDVWEKDCRQAEWAGLFDGMESEDNRDCNGELSSGFWRLFG